MTTSNPLAYMVVPGTSGAPSSSSSSSSSAIGFIFLEAPESSVAFPLLLTAEDACKTV